MKDLNTIHIQQFSGGLNMDDDILTVSLNQYVYAENIRVLTNEGGTSSSLQTIEGLKQYSENIGDNRVIIGTDTINDYGIIITKVIDENGDYKYNEIIRVLGFENNNITHKIVAKGYFDLCYDKMHNKVSIVSNYETDDNIKVYFTDGLSAIKFLNIMSDKFSPDNKGNKNVDLEGFVKYSDSIDITPGAILPRPRVEKQLSGALPVGVVLYCYQLFNIHGANTVVSPLSNIVHLTKSSNSSDSYRYEGAAPGLSSGKSCVIGINIENKSFDRCRIIRIHNQKNNLIPTIHIVDEIKLKSEDNDILYRDSGSLSMRQLSVDEFNSLSNYQFIAKVLDRHNDMLFAANIQDQTWSPEYDARAYRSDKDGNVILLSKDSDKKIKFKITDIPDIPEEFDCINPSNDFGYSKDSIKYLYSSNVFSGLRILGGTGKNISYTFITTEIDLDDMSVTLGEHRTSLNVAPRGLDRMWMTLFDGKGATGSNEYFDLPDSLPRLINYSDPYISSMFKSYLRDEIYRFGIIFYNDKGIATPVYWIGDIRMPSADIPGYEISDIKNGKLIGRPLGVRFRVDNIPHGATQYEIVRCKRELSDRSILMQGIMSNVVNVPVKDLDGSVKSKMDHRPLAFVSGSSGYDIKTLRSEKTDNDNYSYIDRSSISNYYKVFISPESSIIGLDVLTVLGNASDIKTVYGLSGVSATNSTSSDYKPFIKPLRTINFEGSTATVDLTWGQSSSNGSTNRLNTSILGDNAISVLKMYVPFKSVYTGDGMTNIKNVGNKYSNLSLAQFIDSVPYNSLIDVTLYYVSVGDIMFLNIGVNYSSRLGLKNKTINGDDNRMSCSKAGPQAPTALLRINNSNNDIPLLHTVSGVDMTLSDKNILEPLKRDLMATSISSAYLVNLIQSTTPYGGNSYLSRQNSIYQSTGFGDVIVGNTYATKNTFGGDTYIGVFNYATITPFQLKAVNKGEQSKWLNVAYIPMESSINLNLLHGQMPYQTSGSTGEFMSRYILFYPGQMNDNHILSKPYYAYNNVYSNQSGGKLFISKSIYSEDNLNMSNRVTNSLAKTSNEILDNWTQFKFANYIDVDGSNGPITNIKSYGDTLLFWQYGGVGTLSINERLLVNNQSGNDLVIGTGGILSRFDYISDMFGSSIVNDRSIVSTDNAVYWHDFDRNEICILASNPLTLQNIRQVHSLSKIGKVLSYLNERYKKKRDNVLGVYDKKYNDVYFHMDDDAIVYNENLKVFTTIYTFRPSHCMNFRDNVILIKNNRYNRLNSLDIDGINPELKISKLRYVVNSHPSNTKVFDNVNLSGDFNANNGKIDVDLFKDIVTDIRFKTKSQESEALKNLDNTYQIDYREDTYRYAIGRDYLHKDPMSFPSRMRGKYLICDYTFDCTKDKTFRIPYIMTSYRNSNL